MGIDGARSERWLANHQWHFASFGEGLVRIFANVDFTDQNRDHAIGMLASLRELTVLGMRPVMLMLAETVFLAGIIAIMMKLFGI